MTQTVQERGVPLLKSNIPSYQTGKPGLRSLRGKPEYDLTLLVEMHLPPYLPESQTHPDTVGLYVSQSLPNCGRYPLQQMQAFPAYILPIHLTTHPALGLPLTSRDAVVQRPDESEISRVTDAHLHHQLFRDNSVGFVQRLRLT